MEKTPDKLRPEDGQPDNVEIDQFYGEPWSSWIEAMGRESPISKSWNPICIIFISLKINVLHSFKFFKSEGVMHPLQSFLLNSHVAILLYINLLNFSR